jgi:hypothetical protein
MRMKTRKKNVLKAIEIPTPCKVDWDSMAGSSQVRFCAECRKEVYNLSAMSLKEAEAIIASSNGKLCGRLTRLADGTPVSLETPVPVRLIGLRPSPMASAVVTAMLSVGPSVSAQGTIGPRPVATAPASADDPPPAQSEKSVVEASNQALFQQIAQPGADSISMIRAGVTIQGSTGGAIALPQTPLRELYDDSERVVIARAGDSTVHERDGNGRLLRTTTLLVSRTLKGKHRDTVKVYHWVYEGDRRQFKKDRDLLVFLTPREGSGLLKRSRGWELADYSRAVKDLPAPVLETYEQRLKELAAIESRRGVRTSEIVEWLVRCAEDPGTRWEGLTDLVRTLPRPDERHPQNGSPASVLVDTIEANERAAGAEAADNLAELLTSEQKERLVRALLRTERLTEADIELIDLVSDWDDPRLMPFLVSQLHLMEETAPPIVSSIIGTVGVLLEDDAISKLAEEYSNNATYEDLIEEDEESESEEDVDVEDEEETSAANEVTEEEPSTDESQDGADEAEEPVVTPEQALAARRAMLRKFILAVEAKLRGARSM